MAFTAIGLAILSALLFYRYRREKELIAQTLEYYSDLVHSLSSRIKEQKNLANALAHDLKSPLAGIISSAQALEMAGKELPSAYLECLRLMQASGRANLRLLSNFIELVSERSFGNPLNQIPENRIEMIRGLVDPEIVNSGQLEWIQAPWLLKTAQPLKAISCALAEIISVIAGRARGTSKGCGIRIRETFESDSQSLKISMCWSKADAGTAYTAVSDPSYQLALDVLEKCAVKVNTIDHFENSTELEIIIPIAEYAVLQEYEPQKPDGLAAAEMLLEITLRQVKSTALSVGAIADLNRTEDSDNSTESRSDQI